MAYFIKLGERRLITLNNEIEQGIGLNLIFWEGPGQMPKAGERPRGGGGVSRVPQRRRA